MKTYEYKIRDKKNHARKCADTKEAALKRAYERKQVNKEKYGTYEQLIRIGEMDRIGLNAPQYLEDEHMKKSYSYGYFERGSRVLLGKFNQGMCSEEEQRNFGIYDVIYDIPEKFLIELKEYPAYLSGRLYQMGAKAFDFTLENNMSLEDYVSFMSIICPEVNTKEFKEGFLAREIDFKENTKKGSR